MTEKYKIYVPEEMRARLMNDAELFDFLKKDGSVNLNAFLKELLINYFDEYRERKDSLHSAILLDLQSFPSISIRDAKAIADKLPNAEVLPGYGVRAARIDAVPAEIDRFLKAGGFIAGEPVKLEDFSASKPATEEEAAIFDAAVGDYPMMHAKAEEVASRPVPGGMEYLFTARDLPREMPGGDAPKDLPPTAHSMKVYVLVEDGQAPVFTQVIR